MEIWETMAARLQWLMGQDKHQLGVPAALKAIVRPTPAQESAYRDPQVRLTFNQTTT
jgi:hypothetical protein